LCVAAALERQSEHPLAHAVVAYGRERNAIVPSVTDYRAVPGRGGSGDVDGAPASVGSVRWFTERGLWEAAGHEGYLSEGNGVVCVERAGRMIGLLTLSDAVRSESARVVADLRSLVGRVVMLTGDNARTAARVAIETGVTDVYADLLPADKAAAVRTLTVDGPVAMVGDGINDAPALATAAVGVAMGAAGTDVAIEAADVALMGDDLGRLPYAIRLARRTLGIIRQNIAASLVVKAVFLALTFAGVTNLWLAVFADMGISLLVTANALRVLRPERDAHC
jgi:Cd2+/Zn2+-exporting ATPase